MQTSRSHRPSTAHGFTLLEALVALALVGLTLLSGFALQFQQLRMRQGLQFEKRLLSRAEAVVVSVQEGYHPPRGGAVDPRLAWPQPGFDDDRFFLDFEPTLTPGVCGMMVRGYASGLGGRPHDRSEFPRCCEPDPMSRS
ncbi:MAG: prepilin-type N-terminal cleavage/methylation domain-containing protein [Acidobacteriota bacterium]|nr:prepilin-type N-terminal cleavage/methylation domain-containing protein [Acidobacteriota bacterium]